MSLLSFLAKSHWVSLTLCHLWTNYWGRGQGIWCLDHPAVSHLPSLEVGWRAESGEGVSQWEAGDCGEERGRSALNGNHSWCVQDSREGSKTSSRENKPVNGRGKDGASPPGAVWQVWNRAIQETQETQNLEDQCEKWELGEYILLKAILKERSLGPCISLNFMEEDALGVFLRLKPHNSP